MDIPTARAILSIPELSYRFARLSLAEEFPLIAFFLVNSIKDLTFSRTSLDRVFGTPSLLL